MRSKTSYFNRTIFIKTMVRFWPLWAAYFAVWLLCLPLPVGVNVNYYTNYAAYLANMRLLVFQLATLASVVIGMITAALAAMAVWSFMYSARSMSGMASLPVSREGVFFSVTLAGIVPVLASNVLIVLCTLAAELVNGQIDAAALFQWLAVVSLVYVFFYGFAVFCAQLTGNVLILPAVYAVLNVTVYVVWEMVNALCNVFLYGMDGNIRLGNPAKILSPPVKLWTGGTDAIERIEAWDAEASVMRPVSYELHGWGMYLGYALAGLAFAALALWLYKKRRMETAGDTVAVEVLKPVFKYCMSLGGALVLALLVYSIIEDIVGVRMKGAVITLLVMFLGAFLGWMIAKMLIHKSFRVWKHDWLGLIICCGVAAVFMLSMECDLVGYEKHVPDAAEVYSVYVSCQGDGMEIKDPANIEAVTALHRSIVGHKDRYESMQEELRDGVWMEDYNSVYLFITYGLKDDGYVSRRYRLGYFLEQAETLDDVLALQTLANTDEAVLSRKTPSIPVNAETAYYGYAESTVFRGEAPSTDSSTVYEKEGMDPDETNWRQSWDFTPTELAELYETCIVPDIEDGTLGRVWYITDEEYENTVYNARIYIELRQPIKDRIGQPGAGSEYAVGEYSYTTFYTTPTVNSWRTNAWLEKHGVILHTIAEVNELMENYGETYDIPSGVRIPSTASDLIIADGRVG